MKITFEDYQEDYIYENASLTVFVRNDKSVFIDIANTGKDLVTKSTFYELNKTQLKDIIGALLHVQSKLNKNGTR